MTEPDRGKLAWGGPPISVGSTVRVVLLAQDCESTRAVHHALLREYPDLVTVLEDGVSRAALLRRRLRLLGPWTVLGQMLFMVTAATALRLAARERMADLARTLELDTSPIRRRNIRVHSVNDDSTRQMLRRLRPKVVVINGTRIVSAETLRCIDAAFINTHAGITPLYRGVHGGYWALAEGRPDLVGTTVHLVDSGVDTGAVLEQVRFRPSPEDSFVTYPYLHTAAGIPPLLRAIGGVLEGTLQPRPAVSMPSRLRYHPTLWGYLATRVRHGVR